MRPLRAIVCTVGIGILTAASAAHAQSPAGPGAPGAPGAAVPGKEAAKKLFEEGVDLEKKNDYAAALAKYKEAEQITATPGLRFHKGYCLEMLGKLGAALEEYEAADKLAAAANKPDVHAAVAARLEPLRGRIPQIAIRLATPATGAELQLDGVPVALDGKAFRLDPGEHTVTARAPGYKPFTRLVKVPEGVTTTVDVSLDHAGKTAGEPPPPGAVTEPPAEPRRQRSLTLPITTTAAAVVLGGAGVAMFLVAGSTHSDAETDCPNKISCDDEQSRVRTFDALALGSFIAAAGFAVVSVVLWTSTSSERSASQAPPAPRARMIAAPSAIGIEGTFW